MGLLRVRLSIKCGGVGVDTMGMGGYFGWL